MNLKLATGAALVLGLLLVSCGSPPTTTLDPGAVSSAQATVYALRTRSHLEASPPISGPTLPPIS
jgi:hypothetical protein